MSKPLSEEVRSLLEQFDAKLITERQFSILVQAAVADRGEDTISTWRVAEREAIEFWKERATVTAEQQKKRFFELAHERKLSPMTVLACTQLLFPNPESECAGDLTYLLLFAPPEKMVQYHNWHVFNALSKHQQCLFGEHIPHCPVPLFPPGQELDSLNEDIRQIMRRSKPGVNGGEPRVDVAALRQLFAKEPF